MYLARVLESRVRALSRSFPVLLLTGPRQVGKTTLLQHLGERARPPRSYVSLDEYGPRTLALEDPELFLQRHPAPVTIDEVQHAPALLAALKPRVDRGRQKGAYWLTGSQHFGLMRAVSESLAGRVAVLDLFGLSQAEEAGRAPRPEPFRPDRPRASPPPAAAGLPATFARIVRGSYPRFVQPNPPPIEAFYGSYVQTYIERDVRALLAIANLAAFQRFLRLCAARAGQLLNLSDLARDTAVAVSTASEWLHLLEATLQVYLLRPYFENIGKRQIKRPKLYFADSGLLSYLAGWRTAESAMSGAMAGALLENYVVAEILRSYRHRGREAPLWFFRTKEKQEVDLVIAEDGRLFPVEIKLTASPGPHDLRGIDALGRAGGKLGPGAVVCFVPRRTALTRLVDAVPVGDIE
jgi:hypothetical protein